MLQGGKKLYSALKLGNNARISEKSGGFQGEPDFREPSEETERETVPAQKKGSEDGGSFTLKFSSEGAGKNRWVCFLIKVGRGWGVC